VRVRIDRDAPAPPYEQLVTQIRRQIERGTLAPGQRLPTVRALAERIDLVPNTVARAYRELEVAGWIETRGRAGTFAAATLPHRAEHPGALLQDAARAYVARARQLGADDRAALEAVRRAQQSALRT